MSYSKWTISPCTNTRVLFFHLHGNTWGVCEKWTMRVHWHHLASKSFLPVLIPLLPMTIENKDRQSNVVFRILLVQTKLLMRIPVNNKLCLKTSVFHVFCDQKANNCGIRTWAPPCPWSPRCTKLASALSDTWSREIWICVRSKINSTHHSKSLHCRFSLSSFLSRTLP